MYLQSHISENTDEVKSVHELYNTDYATAYDNGGMLTNKVTNCVKTIEIMVKIYTGCFLRLAYFNFLNF